MTKKRERNKAEELQIVGHYLDLKARLGRRPTRQEIHVPEVLPFSLYRKTFGSWLRFLSAMGDLCPTETTWLDTPAEEFLSELEGTRMSKSYKVPAIQTFLQGDTIVQAVSLKAIGLSFMDFFANPDHLGDFQDKKHRGHENWAVDDYMKLAEENPVRFLSRSEFFAYDPHTEVFVIAESVVPYLSPELAAHVSDILTYRASEYFRRLAIRRDP